MSGDPGTGSAGRSGSGGGAGWSRVIALALAAAALSVVQPALLIFTPLALLLVALPPRRPVHVVLGIALAAVVLAGRGGGPVWYVERGWALVLAAWFLALVAAWPAASFLSRALGALGGTVATAAAVLAAGGRWRRLDWEVTRGLRDAAADAVASWGAALPDPGWSARFSSAIHQAVDLQAAVYPALLGLASLAGLAVAWWGFRRLAYRERSPLGPLREFRFRDELVWLVIAGLFLLLLPLGEEGRRAGSNVLVFMGALYVLRGAGVLVALVGAPGPVGVLLAGLALVFLYPLVMAATLLVGLTDTWLDLRARRREAAGPGA